MRIELTGGISEVWRGGEGRIPAITIVLVQSDRPSMTNRGSSIVAIYFEVFKMESIKVWLASFQRVNRYLDSMLRCEFKKKKNVASLD